MTYVELFPQQRRNTGTAATLTRAWPQGVRRIDIQFDVWGANGAADPWTGVAQPFNIATRVIEASLAVQYADGRIEDKAGGNWVGRADGNWARPGRPASEPTMSAVFGPTQELPTAAQLTVRCVSGPITAGLSVQLDTPALVQSFAEGPRPEW